MATSPSRGENGTTPKHPASPLEGEAAGKPATGTSPQMLAEARRLEAASAKVDTSAYVCIRDAATLKAWVAEAFATGYVAVDTETTSLDPMQAELVGFSLATAPGRAAYVPLIHKSGAGDLLGGGLVENQIPVREALAIIKPLMEDASVLKILQSVKYDLVMLQRHGVDITPHDDTMLMSYVLDAGASAHNMDALSEKLLNHKTITFKEVTGTGKQAVTCLLYTSPIPRDS